MVVQHAGLPGRGPGLVDYEELLAVLSLGADSTNTVPVGQDRGVGPVAVGGHRHRPLADGEVQPVVPYVQRATRAPGIASARSRRPGSLAVLRGQVHLSISLCADEVGTQKP